MSPNKYKAQVLVIPEDQANIDLLNGFFLHHGFVDDHVDRGRPAGGWPAVLNLFKTAYITKLRRNERVHVLMLIDLDNKLHGEHDRLALFNQAIPDDLKPRVFLLSSKIEPEALKKELQMKIEEVGTALAEGCYNNDFGLWQHPHLIHNMHELKRMIPIVKPMLFRQA